MLEKYKQNLKVTNQNVYSYGILVAQIINDGTIKNELWVFPKYAHFSVTTTKHINYVASELNLTKIIK